MLKFLFIGSVLVFLAGFASCGNIFSPGVSRSTPMPKSASVLAENVVTAGFLTVGSYVAYPPQESIDPATNSAVGFDIDLITAIARHMNLKVKVVNIDFQNVISNLLAKNVDVAISAIIITPELQRRVNFVPYFIGGESLLVAKSKPLRITDLQQLCGLKVGVSASTLEQKDLVMASSSCVQEKKPAIQVIVLQNQMAAMQMLLNKRVVATYQDSPITDYFINQYPGHFEVGGPIINANLEGIAIRKDNTVMFKMVQAAFTAVKTSGTYCSLIKKWGLTSGELAQNNHSICV